MKMQFAKSLFLTKQINKILDSFRKNSARRHGNLFLNAPDYPSSAASPSQTLAITALGATETLSRLQQLAQISDLTPTRYADLQDRVKSAGASELETSLRFQLDSHGSDKGSFHGYSNLYALLLHPLLSQMEKNEGRVRILEIGLGTNRTNVPSNMGAEGVPGASLRAWTSASKSIEVVGLDIDTEVLFQEPRISTHFVDQLKQDSWLDIPEKFLEGGFDLVIDDGLHAPLANLNTLISTIPFLKKRGTIVIEDIPERALPVWTLVNHFIKSNFTMEIIQFNRAFCVVLTSRD
jgi:hypothetical protein